MGELPRASDGMLSPYRVLDLTDEKGLFCGKLLGDLGADVIKVERPGGDPARMIGPFYHDEVHPEKSLFWWAFNTSKRGITLDIESSLGKETFKKLVRTADFVLESFSPGYLDRLGLGYKDLEKINPGIIMVSISPFGQTGPYKDYKAPDIVAWAMGGQMYFCGDADRPPVRMSQEFQSYLHAASEAAVGAMMALNHRTITGEGQQVDVSLQEGVAQSVDLATSLWDMERIIQTRGGKLPNIPAKRLWPCKDGYVVWLYLGGLFGRLRNGGLVEWIDSEGLASDFLRNFDWSTFDLKLATQDVLDRIAEPTANFISRHTKAELYEGGLKRRIMLYPLGTTSDIANNLQLAGRGFWVEMDHPELGTSITYPGIFARASGSPGKMLRRAPLIGEHNRDVLHENPEHSIAVPTVPKRATRPLPKGNAGTNSGHAHDGILSGVKIADFSWAIAGPRTTKTLADYGAEVIRIETETRPDPQRTGAPFKDSVVGLNRSGDFNQYNTGKLSLALKLTHPEGVNIAKKLVAWADVVVENFAGGVMERMGLGYEELKKINSDIIMLSSCMMGQTGPNANHPGAGYQLTALSGFSNLTGWPDREPAWLGVYTDYIGPHFGALAILAALDYRNRTGKGQYLDTSQYENAIYFMTPLVLDYMVNARVANRMGNRSFYAAPHGAYRCLGDENWCAIAVFSDQEWTSFCRVTGNPAWTDDPRFSTLAARKENEDELEKLVEVWTIDYPAGQVMALMQASGVAAGVLETGQDLLENDPQLRHRRFYRHLYHPEAGKHLALRPSFVLTKSDCELKRAPLLGEHTEYVLKHILYMSDEEIVALAVQGVLG